MHCIHCGATTPANATSCPSCGRATQEAQAHAPAGPDAELTALRGRLQDALGASYTVERVLGQGGFAVVFLVRDETLKRPLAVKVLSPDLVQSKTVIERFRREAETIAQLSHPNIVSVHFVGHREELFYLAMAFVEGESLADRLAREGKLPIDAAATILREIASALDIAHRRGVIHRDIKPHNVLLEQESGRALLTDFGIARTAEGGSLTATGMVVGTPAYMSPEQVTGERVDHRSDIYALGCVAYQMLTGEPPFTGATAQAILFRRVAESPEPVEAHRPEAPLELSEIVNRCLKPDAADRPGSAGEIVKALGGTTPVSGTRSLEARVVKRRSTVRTRRLVAAAATLVIGVAAAVLAFAGRGDPAPPPVPAPRIPVGMVPVPGGMYTIGADDGHRFARPAHSVAVDSFAIDRTEVTNGAYAAFVTQQGMPAPWNAMPDSASPVRGITWTEAQAFCRWRVAGGRLPTEVEWEAAARGSDGRRYPWGDAWQPGAATADLGAAASPARAGSRPSGATPTGIYDLVGNVWEWTASPMAAYPGGATPPRSEGTYVIRGGAFNTPRALATATYRGYMPAAAPRGELAATGFRCAVSFPEG